MRTPDDDRRSATVSVEAVAYGLCALDCPVYGDPQAWWLGVGEEARKTHLDKARFVLGVAEDVDPDFLDRASGAIRWRQ